MPVTVAIYLYKDMEVLDFAGPFEVFTTASRVFLRKDPQGEAPFRVVTAAKTDGQVQARAGLKVLPDYRLRPCPAADLLHMPGGVIDDEIDDQQVLTWTREQSAGAKITASVCTGAFLLAKAGFLQARAATTHWEDIADLKVQFPQVEVREGVR